MRTPYVKESSVANGFDSTSQGTLQKGQSRKRKINGVSYVIKTDQNGQYYQHPQEGRITVVSLYCDCGRSILVSPKEVKNGHITCSRCGSPFRWQQLTLQWTE